MLFPGYAGIIKKKYTPCTKKKKKRGKYLTLRATERKKKSSAGCTRSQCKHTVRGNDHCKWFTSSAGREIWIMIGRIGVSKKGWLIDLLWLYRLVVCNSTGTGFNLYFFTHISIIYRTRVRRNKNINFGVGGRWKLNTEFCRAQGSPTGGGGRNLDTERRDYRFDEITRIRSIHKSAFKSELQNWKR